LRAQKSEVGNYQPRAFYASRFRYCIVRATTTCDDPDGVVAVTFSCGVWLLLELPPPPPPPQFTIPRARHTTNPSISSQRLRRPAKIKPIPPNGSRVANRRPGLIKLLMVIVFPEGTLTVTVAVEGAAPVTGLGLGCVTVHVAPPVAVQARVTVWLNPVGAVKVIVTVSCAPLATVKAVGDAVKVRADGVPPEPLTLPEPLPTPVKETVAGKVLPLPLMISVPMRDPGATGVKVTPTVHDCPGASRELQVFELRL
jgi:hypothetical protein